jgi:hypothetical protein
VATRQPSNRLDQLILRIEPPENEESIFVQVASYRDYECYDTVRNLFLMAADPELIAVGILLQLSPEDADPTLELRRLGRNIRVDHRSAQLSRGPLWARGETMALSREEPYTLQIDSHMRFERDWDRKLKKIFGALPSQRCVLSTYPPNYSGINDLETGYITRIIANGFNKRGILQFNTKLQAEGLSSSMAVRGAFCGACFIFGRTELFESLIYEPDLYFSGEEMVISAQIWTRGYDIYHPNKVILYHRWQRPQANRLYKDEPALAARLELESEKVQEILGLRGQDAMQPIRPTALGEVRSLGNYESFSGINFSSRTISPHAYACLYE